MLSLDHVLLLLLIVLVASAVPASGSASHCTREQFGSKLPTQCYLSSDCAHLSCLMKVGQFAISVDTCLSGQSGHQLQFFVTTLGPNRTYLTNYTLEAYSGYNSHVSDITDDVLYNNGLGEIALTLGSFDNHGHALDFQMSLDHCPQNTWCADSLDVDLYVPFFNPAPSDDEPTTLTYALSGVGAALLIAVVALSVQLLRMRRAGIHAYAPVPQQAGPSSVRPSSNGVNTPAAPTAGLPGSVHY